MLSASSKFLVDILLAVSLFLLLELFFRLDSLVSFFTILNMKMIMHLIFFFLKAVGTAASIVRLFVWMGIGLVFYFSFGFHHSKNAQKVSAVPNNDVELDNLTSPDSFEEEVDN